MGGCGYLPLDQWKDELFLVVSMSLWVLHQPYSQQGAGPLSKGAVNLRWVVGLMAARNTVFIGGVFEMRAMGEPCLS